MKKVIQLFLICLIILLNQSCKSHSEHIEDDCYDEKLSLSMSFVNNEIILPDQMVYYVEHNSNLFFNIYDSIYNPTLILYFSGTSCNLCVASAIEQIRLIFPQYESNSKIIFLGSNINPRKKKNFKNKKILSNDNNSLGLPFEEYDEPFFFILDEDRKVKMFYVPAKFDHKMTSFYLKTIKDRYDI